MGRPARSVQPYKRGEWSEISLEGFAAGVRVERGQVNRQRLARLIARLALGIAVGAALAFVALEYL